MPTPSPEGSDSRQPTLGETIRRLVRPNQPKAFRWTSALLGQPRACARALLQYAALATADLDGPRLNEGLYDGLRFLRQDWRAERFFERSSRVYRLGAFPASRYPGRVCLLRPEQVPLPIRPDDLGWSSLGAVVEVRRIPISPMTFWEHENLPVIGAKLDEALNASCLQLAAQPGLAPPAASLNLSG